MIADTSTRQATQDDRHSYVGPWLRLIVRRLANLVVVLLALMVVSFVMVRLIPGDPALRIAGSDVSPAYVQQIREEFGLNRPMLVQFVSYIKDTLSGNFGLSYSNHQPVSALISKRLPFTLSLAFSSLTFVVLFGFALGMGAAILGRDGKRQGLEHSFTAITGMFGSIPELIVAIGLTFLFAVALPWFPVSGSHGWASVVLPALSIGIRPMFNLARVVRVEARNVLQADYIHAARIKRLPARLIYLRHMLPNVATAALTTAGLLFPFLVGGTVVVENVFAWPGLGTAVVRAVVTADYPVIQACILLLGALVVVTNLIVDILIGYADPRHGTPS